MEFTVEVIKEALAKVTDDVYQWAYAHALEHEADEGQTWDALVDAICDAIGLANDADGMVGHNLSDAINYKEWSDAVVRADSEVKALNETYQRSLEPAGFDEDRAYEEWRDSQSW